MIIEYCLLKYLDSQQNYNQLTHDHQASYYLCLNQYSFDNLIYYKFTKKGI